MNVCFEVISAHEYETCVLHDDTTNLRFHAQHHLLSNNFWILWPYYVWPTSPLFLPNKIAPQKTQNTVPRFIAKTPRPGHATPPCPSEFQEIEPKPSFATSRVRHGWNRTLRWYKLKIATTTQGQQGGHGTLLSEEPRAKKRLAPPSWAAPNWRSKMFQGLLQARPTANWLYTSLRRIFKDQKGSVCYGMPWSSTCAAVVDVTLRHKMQTWIGREAPSVH